MPLKEPENAFTLGAVLVVVLGAVFAMLGGVAKHLSDVQEGKVVFTWVSVGIQAFISAFTGSLASLYMLENEFSTYMILLGSGISGFAGVVLLRLITSKVYQHFGNGEQIEQAKKGESKDEN